MMGLPGHIFIGVELRLSMSADYIQDVNPFPALPSYCYHNDDEPLASTCVVFIDSYQKGIIVHPHGPIESTSFPYTEKGSRRYIRFASSIEIWLRSLRNMMNEFSLTKNTDAMTYSATQQFRSIQRLFAEDS